MGYIPSPPPPRIIIGSGSDAEKIRAVYEALRPDDAFVSAPNHRARCEYCGTRHLESFSQCPKCGAPII
jgi:hypothetical protein